MYRIFLRNLVIKREPAVLKSISPLTAIVTPPRQGLTKK
jgi:hypothetical protein